PRRRDLPGRLAALQRARAFAHARREDRDAAASDVRLRAAVTLRGVRGATDAQPAEAAGAVVVAARRERPDRRADRAGTGRRCDLVRLAVHAVPCDVL